MGLPEKAIFAGIVALKADPRQGERNSNGQQAIFTCVDKKVAHDVIDRINAEKHTFPDVTEEGVALEKLTAGMLAYTKDRNMKENREKYQDSGRNIQVFGIGKEVDREIVERFFAQYGVIKECSKPSRADIDENLFHYNILFETADQARDAISCAAADEKAHTQRLGKNGIRVREFQKKEVQRSKK
jgi:hypothetical protein